MNNIESTQFLYLYAVKVSNMRIHFYGVEEI